jgi:hypothetical protein
VNERNRTPFLEHWRKILPPFSGAIEICGRFGMLHMEHLQLQAEVMLNIAVFHFLEATPFTILQIVSIPQSPFQA